MIFFGFASEVDNDLAPDDLDDSATEWDHQACLTGEKEVLGTYLSGHPVQSYESELRRIVDFDLDKLSLKKLGNMVIAGYITEINPRLANGKIAAIKIEDINGHVTLRLTTSKLAAFKDWLQKDILIVVFGELVRDDYALEGFNIKVKEIFSLDDYRRNYGALELSFGDLGVGVKFKDQLAEIMSAYKNGPTEVLLNYHCNGMQGIIRAGDNWKVNLSDDLLARLAELLGAENITIKYKK